MLHAQLYFLSVFEARNLIFLLFGVNKVLVLVYQMAGSVGTEFGPRLRINLGMDID